MTVKNDLVERAKVVFNAIIANDGEVYAVHNGENVLLKTVAVCLTADSRSQIATNGSGEAERDWNTKPKPVAVADGKLVGIVAANNGGIKTLDISGDKVIRIRTETILDDSADGADE